jgi:DNA (cytosine-5)-methyltransferase 1
VNRQLTLGSLFSGSGGFELGGLLCDIKPIWASEVEPFPIRVVTKRLPDVQHLGDINALDGSKIPPVDIVTFGSPCQSFSVAGKREGMKGKSGLFYQAVRVIREMREATNNTYPRFAVMENVVGIFSSTTDGSSDFQEVLNELISIKNKALSVPLPQGGKWSTCGEVVGDDPSRAGSFSLSWRTFDAQFWGVAQRRRRMYLVVDFDGERAGEILFDESRLRGHPPQGAFPWQGAAGGVAAGSGSTVCLNDQGGSCMDLSEDITGTLRAQDHGHAPIVFEPGAASRIGGHAWEGVAGSLRADAGDNRQAVAIENHPADSRVKISEDGKVQTLSRRLGTGGGNVPLVMNERQYALTVGEDVANKLTSTDYKGTQCVFAPAAFMGGQGSKAGNIAYSENVTPTIRGQAGGNSVPMVMTPKAYGICSLHSNSMQSPNPHSGVYEADTSRTLDTSVPDPNKNAGGMAIVALEGNGSRPSHRGDGFSDADISYTRGAVEKHAVCYQDKVGALCASDYKFPQQQQVVEGKAVVERHTFGNNGHGRYDDKPATLKASGGDYPGAENVVVDLPAGQAGNRYIVRRLTPQECALLQGFPPWWCSDLETPEPTEEDISFWSEIWETHRKIVGTSSRPKSRQQIVKWLQTPHTDAKEYMLWGNGTALPVNVFVLGGIVHHAGYKP